MGVCCAGGLCGWDDSANVCQLREEAVAVSDLWEALSYSMSMSTDCFKMQETSHPYGCMEGMASYHSCWQEAR